jgi:hypothetical protein
MNKDARNNKKLIKNSEKLLKIDINMNVRV